MAFYWGLLAGGLLLAAIVVASSECLASQKYSSDVENCRNSHCCQEQNSSSLNRSIVKNELGRGACKPQFQEGRCNRHNNIRASFNTSFSVKIPSTCARPQHISARCNSKQTRTASDPDKGVFHNNVITEHPMTSPFLESEMSIQNFNCQGCKSYAFKFPFLLDSGSNLVAGGVETSNTTVFICRVYFGNETIPGKGVRDNENWICWVGRHDLEIRVTNTEKFEILTNPNEANLTWTIGNRKDIPRNTIPGGRTANAEHLYISRCHATHDGKDLLIPGSIHANSPDYMTYSYGGRECKCADFDLLTCETCGYVESY